MPDIPALKAANAHRWSLMKVLPELTKTVDQIASRLIAPIAKEHYVNVAVVTHVPWFIIAVIHEREASQSWNANIANGDAWNKPTIHVPRGRGPFQNWEAAAIDALSHCAPFASRWTDWTVGGALTLLEEYNGLGYAVRDIPSPYIWASTDQYIHGKYIADGHFDPNAVDHQLGCAALLCRMEILDQTIKFEP